jgi:hypothetical protein
MSLRISDLNFKEAFWHTVHLFDLQRGSVCLQCEKVRTRGAHLTVCSRTPSLGSSNAELRAKGDTEAMMTFKRCERKHSQN